MLASCCGVGIALSSRVDEESTDLSFSSLLPHPLTPNFVIIFRKRKSRHPEKKLKTRKSSTGAARTEFGCLHRWEKVLNNRKRYLNPFLRVLVRRRTNLEDARHFRADEDRPTDACCLEFLGMCHDCSMGVKARLKPANHTSHDLRYDRCDPSVPCLKRTGINPSNEIYSSRRGQIATLMCRAAQIPKGGRLMR